MLEATKVTKYFGGMAAVSNVDFSVSQGEIVGLIGPNGAGKTTLFNLISGALPLSSGEIRFKGQKISGLKPHQICRMGWPGLFNWLKYSAICRFFRTSCWVPCSEERTLFRRRS